MESIIQRLKEHMKKRMPSTLATLKNYPAILRIRLAGKIMPPEGQEALENRVRSIVQESNRAQLRAIWEALQIERTRLRKSDFSDVNEPPRPDTTEFISSAEDSGMARAIRILEAIKHET